MKENKREFLSIFSITIFILLSLYLVSLVMPIIWALYTSFKSRGGFIIDKIGLPKIWEFGNYQTAYNNFFVAVSSSSGVNNVYIVEMFTNSLIYCLGCTVTATITPCIMAYLCSKYQNTASKIIYSITIVTMIIPIVGALPSEIQMSKALNLYDTFYGLWFMRATFAGMYFLVFYASFKTISWFYAESAFIDGASHFRVFIHIMLPLVKTTIYAVCVLTFINFWNDYQIPMIYLPSRPTAAYGAYMFQFSQINSLNSVPMRLTGAIIVSTPIIIVYSIFARKLTGSITAGGLKG